MTLVSKNSEAYIYSTNWQGMVGEERLLEFENAVLLNHVGVIVLSEVKRKWERLIVRKNGKD